MRAVIQRVLNAAVAIDGRTAGEIGHGMLVLLGVGKDDTEADIERLASKLVKLRIFEDENDKMNLSLKDIDGEIMAVSQFTLYGDCRRGRRPSFTDAARPEVANPLYEEFVEKIRKQGITVGTGEFGAHMMVELVNDGPVTILLESKKAF